MPEQSVAMSEDKMGRYYGDSGFHFAFRITDAVKWLIIVNAVVFLLQTICVMLWKNDYLALLFGLNAPLVLRGMIWQPVTYMFLHTNLWHIFVNMWILWMFGSSVEEVWGPKSFLHYYFLTGIGAGLLSLLADIVTGATTGTVGASGAIFGVLIAFGMLFPNRVVLFFCLFPMRAKHLVMVFAAIELLVTLAAGPHAGRVARFRRRPRSVRCGGAGGYAGALPGRATGVCAAGRKRRERFGGGHIQRMGPGRNNHAQGRRRVGNPADAAAADL